MTTIDNRLQFHEDLVSILGSSNVYFQPPENFKMEYPAIVYSRDSMDNLHADNNLYLNFHSYSVTYIDEDPDSLVIDKLAEYPMSRFNRHYVSDGLNHDVFTVFYR